MMVPASSAHDAREQQGRKSRLIVRRSDVVVRPRNEDLGLWRGERDAGKVSA
jgi:hypothetical protein